MTVAIVLSNVTGNLLIP